MRKSMLFALLILGVGISLTQLESNHGRRKYYTTTWDTIRVTTLAFGVDARIDAIHLAGTDTLFVAKNWDTNYVQRWPVFPSTTNFVGQPIMLKGVKFVAVRAAHDSVLAQVNVY